MLKETVQTGGALAPGWRGEWPVLSDSQGSAGTWVSAGGHGALLS